MPNSLVLTPSNLLLIASGMDPVLRWDGLADEAEPAGVAPPASALTVSGSGSGNIVGDYYAYQRFVDQYGNVSNLSPISALLTAAGPSGTITDASAATPIVITSTAHNLQTGQVVRIQNVQGNTDANGVWTITVLTANTFSLDGSSGNTAFFNAGTPTWTSGLLTINYSGVEVPTETKVVLRQILRNTAGEATVFYVDVETDDLTSTVFSSTREDSDLSAQTSVPLVNSAGESLANLYTVPPNWKPFLAHCLDRMFYAGEVVYSEGNVAVTFGSTSVTGIGTEWTSALVGRYIYVDGAKAGYLISAVNVSAQTLTLSTAYAGATSAYSFYAIRPGAGERRLVYYSEAGLPEAVPATNAFSIQEDGDEITGLMMMKSFLYVLERRHVWRITFETDPAKDGGTFLATLRGCLNNRCAVVVDDTAYCLDQQGIHAFGGGGDGQSVSTAIQTIFRQDFAARWQVNWEAQRFFHACLFPSQEVIRFFICLGGDYLPRHCLAFAYRTNRWWIEGFSVPIGASVMGRLGPLAGTWRVGTEQLYLGSECNKILAYWRGTIDGPAGKSSLRGDVTSATIVTLTDAGAAFVSADIVGAPVTITAGRGKTQTRIVISATASTLTLDRPWMTIPDTTSKYQVGGVNYRYLGGWHNFAELEDDNRRTLEVYYEPTLSDMTLDMRRHLDMDHEPEDWGVTQTDDQQYGVATAANDPDAVVSLSRPQGIARKRCDGHSERDTMNQFRQRMEVRGVTGPDQVSIYRLAMDGVTPAAGKGVGE